MTPKILFVFVLLTLLPLFTTKAVKGIQYKNVGGSGAYGQVTNMKPNNGVWNVCNQNDPDTCRKSQRYVSGPLAPFNGDLTVALRGPMNVLNFAVYYPSGQGWNRVSYWDNSNVGTSNLNWMNNAGEWSVCHGSGQSYMAQDGKGSSTTSQRFNGVLGNDVNVNLMSSANCNANTCSGFTRGVAKVGWKGNDCGEKMFAIKVLMPNIRTGGNNDDMPAIWLLNGEVVRANQWGCNCRGMGGNGGCGELDIAEILQTGSSQCTSTLYSFKQSLGSPDYFDRPTGTAITYVVVFDGRGTGTVSIFTSNSFPFASTTIPQSLVQTWISNSNPSVVSLNQPYTGISCSQISGIGGAESENTASTDGHLSTPMSVGIGVGVAGLLMIVVVVVVIFVKRRRSAQLEVV